MTTHIKLYLAGPLFTLAEREFNRQLKNKLTRLGYDVFLPQEAETTKRANGESSLSVVQGDKDGVEWCDVLLAILDGADPDSGTSVEVGIAIAKNKWTLGIRTDFRMAEAGERVNLMFLLMDNILYYDGQSIGMLAHKIREAILGGQH